MKYSKEDYKAALKSIATNVIGLLAIVAKVFIALFIGTLAVGAIGYLIGHFFLQLLVLFGIVMLGVWFMIELQSARQDREYQEIQQAIQEARKRDV